MQFGMPTLIELPNIEDCAKLCKELGLNFIELNMNLPEHQPSQIDIEKMLRLADKYNIYYTIHLDENFNPCDFNKSVSNAYVETAIHTINIAKKLSAPIINLHLSDGVYFTMPDRKVYLFEQYKEEYLKEFQTFRDVCKKEIGGNEIKLCIENCGGYLNFQKEAINMLLQSAVFGLTLDIGHSHSADCVDEAVIFSHKDRLNHFHIHDALRKKNHLVLGTGEIDLPKYLSLAGENSCRAVIETKTIDGLRKSVEWLQRHK